QLVRDRVGGRQRLDEGGEALRAPARGGDRTRRGRRRRTSDGGHEGISDRGLPPAARRAGPGPRAGRRHRARGVALRGARGVEMSETKELHLKPGDPAPDFELLDQNGNTVRLSDYRGQKLLIYF